jgi:hypothetical protein
MVMKNYIKKYGVMLLFCPFVFLNNISIAQQSKQAGPLYKVGILGAPSFPEAENPALKVVWNDENMARMKRLGFNTMQLNMAWAYRPYDEALNIEDVVALPDKFMLPIDEAPGKTYRTPEKIAARAAELRRRIALCKKYGMHTIFHFGAPFVGFPPQLTEPLPQNITDEVTVQRYKTLIREFGKQFPGVDDLLIYTYDQDAWLSSEFGPTESSHGVPAAERVSKFINSLAHEWKTVNTKGTLFWEPWEFSAGETYRTMDMLDPACVGMSIHSSVAEVMIANPADRWFRNVVYKAEIKHIPVIGEVFMGGPTEEMEPYTNIQAPLSTLRELQAVNNAGKLTGIKEYFGDVPDKEDPNLRMSGIFFHNPQVNENDALTQLAAPYGTASAGVIKYWKLVTAAINFAPWDISWRFRRVGYSDPSHLMTAATLKGASWQTPGWQSSRRSTFIRTDEQDEPNFWLREDIQLRLEESAATMDEALAAGSAVRNKVPRQFQDSFDKSITQLTGFKVRLLAYAYHLRETNLADDIRTAQKMNLPVRPENVKELRATLVKDQLNQGTAEPIGAAIKLLDEDLNKFLATYFLPSDATGAKDGKGSSITSN